ncbi:MAG: CHAT domain-containing protein [Richelia sp. CSU_2_1]|nr:CHAT domain-containing protein [Richelia sp. CSU_2_1]
MDKNRINAYWQLIQKLLESPNGEQRQILNAHFKLLDPGLLQTIIAVAQQLDDDGNQNDASFLTKVALQLGEFLGGDPQPKLIRKQIANILLAWGIKQYDISQFILACQCWEHSLIIYQDINDRQGEADSLGNLGNAYNALGQHKKAIAFFQKTLAIQHKIKDYQGEAYSLINLGNAYTDLFNYKEAIVFYQKSLRVSKIKKNLQEEANALLSLGGAYYDMSLYQEALNFNNQALKINNFLEYYEGKAVPYGNLGNIYHAIGEYNKAINCYEQSWGISRAIRDHQGEAASLGSLGNVYLSMGQYEKAMDYYQKSLVTTRAINDPRIKGNLLNALGNIYFSIKQYEQATICYTQHLDISLEIKDLRHQVVSLNSLGNVCEALKRFEDAITILQQSWKIAKEIQDSQGKASALGSLGIVYSSLGQYEQSISFHQQHLNIAREIKARQLEGVALNNIANVYQQLQETEVAIEKYRDCLTIATSETMPPLCFTAGHNLGNIGFTQSDWQLALEGYEPAIQAVEQLRKGSTTDDRRQKIIAEAISVYANAVQCYINLKQYDRAVETADRSRSRHLADLFASKDLYPQGEIPPEVEAYYRLQEQINRLRSSENDGMKALATTPQPTPNCDAIIEKIQELEKEKKKVWLKIRSKDEVLAGQLQPELLYVKDMQALIPDAETAILNFYSTGEHTHIFILRQDRSTQLHTCEGQGVETLQDWLLNNWLKPYKENEGEWKNQMGEFLHELANRLQIDRLISQHLNNIKELIIIPHLYLHQIPFAALPLNEISIPQSDTASDRTRALKPLSKPTITPAKTPPQKQPEYLSDKFRLRIVPSSQILNFCHQRGNLKPATMGIVENATGDLVFTGYECETLATMHQIDKNSRLEYEQATIGNYQNLLDRVQVLHSSHHASADLNNSLESKLHLFDGDINLGRVFTWRFTDLAEVFLSCCETNLTLTQITDDPLSIASGFLCAGARNAVSTLWAVDDLATALFCILYYQEKQDKSRSEAMRQAQYKLRNLTGDELSAKYKLQLENYFEGQEWGENKAEIVNNVRVRLELRCREKLPFVSPHYWAGFVSQGLA